jgi:uncharacterized protein YjlB
MHHEPQAPGLNEPKVTARVLPDDGVFPNSHLPVLFYEGAFASPSSGAPSMFEEVFDANGWGSQMWRNGIYDFHHYHSTAHEVLGCYAGSANVQLGGPSGITISLEAGDALIIPAGVAHCNLGSSSDFGVVGAYPRGLSFDICRGKPGERPKTDEHIRRVPLPKCDPVYGREGPLEKEWQ